MQSIELKAMSAAYALEQNGFDHTPVLELLKQRADLLEALKAAQKKGIRWHPADPVVQKINAAITKAEATK